jgi:hypothetical protein
MAPMIGRAARLVGYRQAGGAAIDSGARIAVDCWEQVGMTAVDPPLMPDPVVGGMGGGIGSRA